MPLNLSLQNPEQAGVDLKRENVGRELLQQPWRDNEDQPRESKNKYWEKTNSHLFANNIFEGLS